MKLHHPFAWILIAFFAATPLSDAKDKKTRTSSRDGSSFEKAIILKGNEEMAKEEWDWIVKFHPELKKFPLEHNVISHNRRLYGCYFFTTPHGQVGIYFDLGLDDG